MPPFHSNMLLKDPLHRMAEISDRYASAPQFEESAIPAWLSLARESMIIANGIRKRLTVIEVAEDEPYGLKASKMFEDIERGRIKISTNNCDHPLWKPEENVAFRLVHDVLGHHPMRARFTWEGEIQACSSHRRWISPLAANAMQTECIGQVAYFFHNRSFAQQKVAFL